ncbi:hypothetical protein [uncultured Nonlabens sp.]|uniref:hypothetical protein n=1 Tax=uncultured Nonlabens sp. TaxID=859306 RepID=UPI002610BA90|nr:hypothetical protein [uncultured Nonlabens sp.]
MKKFLILGTFVLGFSVNAATTVEVESNEKVNLLVEVSDGCDKVGQLAYDLAISEGATNRDARRARRGARRNCNKTAVISQ